MAWFWILAPSLLSYATLGKGFNLSVAYLPYLNNGINNIYLMLMLWRLNEFMYGKHLEECLTHSRCQPRVCFIFFGGREQVLINLSNSNNPA